MKISVKVREYGGTYIARSAGLTASCTSRREEAVKRVALKVAWRENPEITEADISAKFSAQTENQQYWVASWSDQKTLRGGV